LAITVDPQSIRAYGSSAQEIFGLIRSELEGLVQDAVSVDYKGENAVAFKTDCGNLAADFATALSTDLRAIADAVRASTSNIVGALGGARVDIQVAGGSVSVPAVPAGDGTYSADPAGLEGLKGDVRRRLGAVSEHFNTHLSRLQSTAWTGQAKDSAVASVSRFTSQARAKADEAAATITAFIEKQLEALRAADRG
jgi:hypothetical protein